MRARLLPILLVLVGCTSFANVRSAEVRPGPSQTLQVSFTTPPGEAASWFWSDDCGTQCNRGITAWDLTVAVGRRPTLGPPFTLGVGVTGILYPYAEAYVQLRQHPRNPFGIGGRLGLGVDGWSQHQLYARFDAPLGPGARLLFNPGVFYQVGNSPNGQNPGSFLGLVGAFGVEMGSGPVALTPGLAFVRGRAEHRSYGVEHGPVTQPFVALSLGLVFRRGRR